MIFQEKRVFIFRIPNFALQASNSTSVYKILTIWVKEIHRQTNLEKIASVYPETMLVDVILRSPANGGTTKNLEILRCPQDDKAEISSRSSS
ncbi:MAG: hypothetical protein P8017_10795 [Deltaproteobacteria bacterium]|jgi:hypothetical protein